jgi:glycogen operon protein
VDRFVTFAKPFGGPADRGDVTIIPAATGRLAVSCSAPSTRQPIVSASRSPGPFAEPGATWNGSTTTFRLWSGAAHQVAVVVRTPAGWVEVPMLPTGGGWWQAHVTGAAPGTRYGYRVHGPTGPGHRFDPSRILVDPYGHGAEPDGAGGLVSVVVDTTVAGLRPRRLGYAWSDTVIYEAHPAGVSAAHPGVPASLRGTYLGACHPAILLHLRRLGVTAVEFLPIAGFVDEAHLREAGRINYWGYNPIAFAAPHVGYSAGRTAQTALDEFRTMVDAFHMAGIEVILDVVFNHTGEAGPDTPAISLRGIDDAAYYRHAEDSLDRYDDVTGCGNTLDVRSPATVDLIRRSLHWWVEVGNVDGFRFDLATTLGRTGPHGAFDPAAPLLHELTEDPALAGIKLIAEPWDCAGYAVGAFPTGWAEWNDRYRNDVRDYWRGAAGRGVLATRLAGSSDLFRGRGATASVNFITAHDGFTLADLVTYNEKQNEENGEANRDGTNDNRSWNCGTEGPSGSPDTLRLRRQQMRNLTATQALSRGIPMILAGDEGGRTQGGNNNAYTATDVTRWATRWDELDAELVDFCATALRLRRRLAVLHSDRHLEPSDVTWYAPHGGPVDDWHASGAFAMVLHDGATDVAVLTNPTSEAVTFHLPGRWSVLLDSAPVTAPGSSADGELTLVAHSLLVASRRARSGLQGRS